MSARGLTHDEASARTTFEQALADAWDELQRDKSTAARKFQLAEADALAAYKKATTKEQK